MGYVFIVVFLVLYLVLAFVDAHYFIRYDGKTKRGLRVGSSRLSSDMENFLRNLLQDLFEEGTNAFIKKENWAVLIQPIPSFFYRSLGIWYVGYVDLSREEPRIEYRIPISATVILVPVVAIMLEWIIPDPAEEVLRLICCFIIPMAIYIYFAHDSSKKKVLQFIGDMMSRYRN